MKSNPKNLIIIIILSLSSCNLLVEEPEHIVVTDGFYKSEGDAVAAVNSIYNRLAVRMYNRGMYIMADLPADDYKNGQGMPNPFLLDLEFLRMTPENQFVGETWNDHYDGINRANTAINRIPEIEMNENRKNRLIGEARFIRGLLYFNLVRFFGDVPLVTLDTRNLLGLNVARSKESEVYKLIIEDMIFASTNLPFVQSGNDLGRATKGSAKILLGKVYLTMKDWDNAISVLAEVIDNEGAYGYGLHDNFRNNWNRSTENGSEMVFAIQFMQPPGISHALMRLSAPRNRVPGLIGNEADIPTQEIFDLFEKGDSRRDATFYTSFERNGITYNFPFPFFYKYFDPSNFNSTNISNANVFVLRYSDALLMYAEALNEKNGPENKAFEALNRVRNRAFGNNNYEFTNLNQSNFREAVYLERRKEFVLEGQRWFDLVRTGRFVETMKNHTENGGNNVQLFHVLMPIPQREIDTNPDLVQNEGY
jgi:hypothetical protein